MNKVFLIGNLTRDPELTSTPSGVSVCHFAIAVNRNYSNTDGERQTDFFNWHGMESTCGTYRAVCEEGQKSCRGRKHPASQLRR